MSFGFSVGDFITTINLANDLRSRFVDAPKQWVAAANDVKTLARALQDVDVLLPQRDIELQRKHELNEIHESCHKLLEELRRILDKNQDLIDTPKSVRQRARVVWKKMQWDQREVDNLGDRLGRSIAAVNTIFHYLNIEIVTELKDRITRVHEREEAREHRALHKSICDWLSPVDHISQQYDIEAKRLDGTGEWLLRSDEFEQWLAGPGETMLCQGIPGAGKTILSSFVISHLQEEFRGNDTVGIAFLYFNYKSLQEQVLGDLLGSLVRQLIQEQRTLPTEIQELFMNHENGKKKLTTKTLAAALQVALRVYSRVFIIVDALDEYYASSPSNLRSFLTEIFEIQRENPFSFLATTRCISDITSQFEKAIWRNVSARDEDILLYINSRMSELLGSRISLSPDLQEKVRADILQATDGMFLLATFHMDSLKGQPTIGGLKRALKALPRGPTQLDDTYDQAMERIELQPEGYRNLAKNILTWVIHAKRDLRHWEIPEALAIEIGTSSLDREMRPDLEIVGSICAGLVTVDVKTKVVRLTHYTAQEYFKRRSWFPNAHLNITRACVTYLSYDAFQSGGCKRHQDLNLRLLRHHFYRYAASYWGEHAKQLLPKDIVILRFLQDVDRTSACLQAILNDRQVQFEVYQNALGIHLTAFLGLHELVATLIREGQSPHSQDSLDRTPLWYAAYNGKSEAVKMLLQDYSVDPNCLDNKNRTALSVAAELGHTSVVDSLLELDSIEPNIADMHAQRTALGYAASKGHLQVVESLLADPRVEPMALDHGSQTALHVAILGCHEVVALRLLEDNRIDINSVTSGGRTPLMLAADKALSAVIQAILSKDNVNVDVLDSAKRNALSYAAEYARSATFEMILKKSAQGVDGKDRRGRSPLWYAVKRNNMAVVELLLTQRLADSNVQDNDSLTPLWYAVKGGNLMIAKLLLEYGVDANQNIRKGRTALSYAAENGYQEVIELLVSFNVDPNQQDQEGRTPLSRAAEAGNEEIAKMFLSLAIDASQDDEKGRQPLSYAAQSGSRETVKLLLDHGADASAQDKEGRRPLSYAAQNGSPKIVKLLLNHGADASAQDDQGRVPLSYAAEFGCWEVIKILSQGINTSQIDVRGRSAISYAAERCHLETVELLLNLGFDASQKDDSGYTPLSYAVMSQTDLRKLDTVDILLTKGDALPDLEIMEHMSGQATKGFLEDWVRLRVLDRLKGKVALARCSISQPADPVEDLCEEPYFLEDSVLFED